MTLELERAARPGDPSGVLERIDARRARRATLRKAQVVFLALAVLAATGAGFVALRAAFREDDRRTAGQPVLPANGDIVFSRDLPPDSSKHLFAVRLGVEDERQITSGPDQIYTGPSVSPDGTTIVAAYFDPSFLAYTPRSTIVTVPIDGGPTVQLTEPIELARDPAWSQDGTMIAFAGMPPGAERRGIYVMQADGSTLRRVAEIDGFDLREPDWSPDGRTLVFVGLRRHALTDDPSDLFTVRLDGSELADITDTPEISEWSPSWAPDGSVIAYGVGGRKGTDRIELIDPSGRPAGVAVDEGSDVGDVEWSPDGQLIAFTSMLAVTDTDDEGDADAWIIRRDGTGLRNLTTEGAYGITWQPVPVGSELSVTSSPQPSVSPSPESLAVRGVPFPVCAPRSIPIHIGGSLPEAVILFDAATDGSCVSSAGTYIGILDVGSGDVLSYTGPIPKVFRFADTLWPFATPDLDGDGIDEIALGYRGSKAEGFVEVTFYRVVLASDDPSSYAFERIVSDCGPGCDPYQPFEMGGVESGTAGVYCGQLRGEGGPDVEGVVQWSTGMQTELGTVRAYVHEYDDGTLRFLTSTSWEAASPTELPPTGLDDLCGSATFWPQELDVPVGNVAGS